MPTSAPPRRTPDPMTRADWFAAADTLLAPVARYAVDGGSLIHLPGPVSASGRWSDGLEGFARTFLLAAFRVRGAEGEDPAGLLDRYAEGLRHGTDPGHPDRWPRIGERRQAVVEAASVAIGLSETRPWLWDRLDDTTRARTVDWLADIVGTRGYGNNWTWFQTVVEAFLASVGGPWSQDDLDHDHAIQESLAVGDGWYSDGRGRDGRRQSFDYYTGWAWHVYPLLESRIRGLPLADVHRDRLRDYLGQAQHLVGARGAPVLVGRSVTYRHAVLAPFWAGALAGATPLTPGQTRAVTTRVAQHFADAGAVDARGLLPVGWHGAFSRVRQLYTGGSSPYWASKGFLGLLLPASSPVWTHEPAPLAGWTQDQVVLLRAPGWVVSSTTDGIVRVHNHGSDRLVESAVEPRADDPFYRRHGYSTHTSPQLSPQAVASPLESHVALLDTAGRPSHRDGIVRVASGTSADGAWAVSTSDVHWLVLPGADDDGTGARADTTDAAGWASVRRGPRLATASVVRGPAELRLAWLDTPPAPPVPGADDVPAAHLDPEAAWPHDEGPWTLHLGGWPLAAPGSADLTVQVGAQDVRVVRTDGAVSVVRGVRGLDVPGSTRRRGADPFGTVSVTPWVRGERPLLPGDVGAALIVLAGADADRESPTVEPTTAADGDRRVVVTWPDGHVDEVPTTAGAVR